MIKDFFFENTNEREKKTPELYLSPISYQSPPTSVVKFLSPENNVIFQNKKSINSKKRNINSKTLEKLDFKTKNTTKPKMRYFFGFFAILTFLLCLIQPKIVYILLLSFVFFILSLFQ